jgi:glutamate/aspartate transport system substrate-binding protein
MALHMTKHALRAVGALALAACCGIALAQEAAGVEKLTGTLRKVKASGAVTIGFRDASVPFSYVGPGRKPMGYSIDLCLAIVEQMEDELGVDALQVKYVSVNPQNRIAMVAGGTVDLECGQTTNNAERRKSVAFSPIMFVSGTKLLVRRPVEIRSYRDLRNATVVAVEGTTNEAAIRAVERKERLGIRLLPLRDNDQALQALQSRTADAWAGDDVVLYAAAAEAGDGAALAVVGDFISYDPYGILFCVEVRVV